MATILSDIYEDILKLYTNYKKTSVSRHTLSYLETRKELLEQYWMSYSNEHHSILKNADISAEGRKSAKELFSNTQEIYLDFKTALKEEIMLKSSSPTQAPTSSVISKPKLPPINLPTFSGNYGDWINFKDLFSSLIDQDKGLSDIQKHHYLRSSLKGEAEQLLRHFDVTAANYSKAWETLVNRYSNKRIIVNNVLSRLLNQKKLTYECPKGLKDLLDTTNECINSLNNLEIETRNWDPIVVHIVVSKLDLETHKAWEQSLGASTDLPTLSELNKYLEGRFRAIEMVQVTQKRDRKDIASSQLQKTKAVKTFYAETETECTYCKNNHYICHCTDFTTLTVEQRRDFAKNNNLCFNCLVKGHSIRNCRQRTTCRTCNYKHHTLLHNENLITKTAIADSPDSDKESCSSEPVQITSMKVFSPEKQVLLATAQVGIKNRNETLIHLRALVDQGSQATFITESAVQLLNLKKTLLETNITGISNHAVKSRYVVNFDIYSPLDSKWVTKISAHVLTKLTPLIPTRELDISQWSEFNTIPLSDTHMNKPGPIDLLLGADIYSEILLEGLKKSGSLIAQNSKLGWLVSGTAHSQASLSTHTIVVSSALVQIEHLLRKFWETEEYLPHEKPLTLDEIKCEEHFVKTHTRTNEGRYIVSLPFRESYETRLGDSRKIAHQRLLQMEKRFIRKPEFKKKYTDFIDEYQNLDHMEDVSSQEKITHKPYYLPHHAVVNESSLTTKLRVVFDGSAKPEHGTALNDELLIGPALQQDLRDLIIRWRTHKICLIADIKQMYRQILISKNDVDYQRILWRRSPLEEVTEKRLLTVTYGTSCAPFLAIRTLKQ
ncbi:uncharacterized protein LOC106134183 [Amyelois transitella]|uniref:uncharacterized protein LOC106134183 n=1 Tax=Amyelois transitella TaxID=680683 RepID=UPI00299076D3|nr:uncharacterized protein LOC106134183 [Amyelois transitella]